MKCSPQKIFSPITIITCGFILLTGCNAENQLLHSIVTIDGQIIEFTEWMNLEVNEHTFRIATGSGMTQHKGVNGTLLSIDMGPMIEPGEAWHMEHEYAASAYISLMKETNLNAAFNHQNPLHEMSPDKDINYAHCYEQIEWLFRETESELLKVKNTCNFPGSYTSAPTEQWQCGSKITYPDDENFVTLCNFLEKMDLVDPATSNIIDFPLFFDDQEYLLKLGDKIYRFRTYVRSTNSKGRNLLEEILKNAKPMK